MSAKPAATKSLLDLADTEFEAEWFDMDPAEKAALPDEVRRQTVERCDFEDNGSPRMNS